MQQLDLVFPNTENLRLREGEKGREIFDMVRKKWLLLLPEEWVRQNFLDYLINSLEYPASRIAVEKKISLNQMDRRPDVVVFDQNGDPEIIVECKAPEIKLTEAVLEQAGRYNMVLGAPILVVTNGNENYGFEINRDAGEFTPIKNIPKYSV